MKTNKTVRNVAAMAIMFALLGGQTTLAANPVAASPKSSTKVASKASAKKAAKKKRLALQKAKPSSTLTAATAQPQATQKVESDFVDTAGNPVDMTPQRVAPQAPQKSAGQSTAQSTVATKVEAPKKKRIGLKDANWRVGAYSDSFANKVEQAQITSFRIRGNARYGLLPRVALFADIQAGWQSGYAQSVSGGMVPANGFSLKEGVVEVTPFDGALLKGGVVNQGHFDVSQVNDYNTFPGALEKVEFGPEVFKTTIIASQSIPTSTTKDEKSTEADVTPLFTTETLKVASKLSEAFSLSVFGAHYRYANLPSAVADASKGSGNTIVTDTTINKSAFKYGFNGYVVGGGTAITFTPGFSWNLGGRVIQNTEAEGDAGAGNYASTGLTISLPGAIDLAPAVEVFTTGSDVTPGQYGDSELGNGNRKGWTGELSMIFKDAGFKLVSRYITSDLIKEEAGRSPHSQITLKFETLYDSLLK
ncbi:MAG: hypothetical protein V4692_14140 [Bdellovibrionota bacterium]